jgi:hypothetical protein
MPRYQTGDFEAVCVYCPKQVTAGSRYVRQHAPAAAATGPRRTAS